MRATQGHFKCEQLGHTILFVHETEEKSHMKGFHFYKNYHKLVLRFFRKLSFAKILEPNYFSAGVLSKMTLFAKMSVRDVNIFTSLIKKTELGLKIQVSAWYSNQFL